jgi:outer membrane protein assembly factor BamB
MCRLGLRGLALGAASIIPIFWSLVAFAHAGVSVTAPLVASAPVFEGTGAFPSGCNLSGTTGYAGAAGVPLGGRVTVFVLHTDTDLYFCFVGLQARADPLSSPSPNTVASVYFDRFHEGSESDPLDSRLLIQARPTLPAGASGVALTGVGFATSVNANVVVPSANWAVNGADSKQAEFLITWNAEIRISRAMLVGTKPCPLHVLVGHCGSEDWHTVGLRLTYQDGGESGASGTWPLSSIDSDPGGWGDLLFAETREPPIGVFTNLNNNARTGAYFDSVLTPTTVIAGSSFGKLNKWDLEGEIYAQPLYVHGLTMADGKSHNVVYAATEKNFVYAFDADSFAKLWSMQLGNPVPSNGSGCSNLVPYFGITSTPVIEINTNTIFVVAVTTEWGLETYKLHAIDLTTGSEKNGSPIAISASVKGSGDGSQGNVINFEASHQLNRPGLLLSDNKVYIAFGSHCDQDPYHGWVIAYDTQTLRQVGVFITTPTGERGGIWQAGRGLVADQLGNVFLMTGNGTVSSDSKGNRTDFSESFVRLDPLLRPNDWWTVEHLACYNEHDLDLGSSGPILLIAKTGDLNANRVIGGGKEGHFYLLNAMSLGHSNPPLDDIIATEQPQFVGFYCKARLDVEVYSTSTHHIHGGPVLWDQSSFRGETLIYNMGEDEPLKAFAVVNGGTKIAGPRGVSKFKTPKLSMPGAILSLSSSKSPGSGLIWALHALKDDASVSIVEGMLSVFEATPTPCIGKDCTQSVMDLRLLWHSKLNPRDDVGMFAKFTPATIADGKVFVPSFGDPKDPSPDRPSWLLEYGLIGNPH